MDSQELSQNGQCLETVRALHKTVVSLREALEQSRSEILELKSKPCPVKSVQEVLKNLSIENHILRQKIVNYEGKEDAEIKDKLLINISEDKKVQTDKHVQIVTPRKPHTVADKIKTETDHNIISNKPNISNIKHLETKNQSKFKSNINQPIKKHETQEIIAIKKERDLKYTPLKIKQKEVDQVLGFKKERDLKQSTPFKFLEKEADAGIKNIDQIKRESTFIKSNSAAVDAKKEFNINADDSNQKNTTNVTEEANSVITSISKEGKKHIIDVKIDVNVFKQSKKKNQNITAPTEINENIPEINANEIINKLPDNSKTQYTKTDCENYHDNDNYLYQDKYLSESFDDSSLEKSEFENIFDNANYEYDNLSENNLLRHIKEPEIYIKPPTPQEFSDSYSKNIGHKERISSNETLLLSPNSDTESKSVELKSSNLNTKILVHTEALSPRKISKSIENLIIKSPVKTQKALGFSKTLSYSNLSEESNSIAASFEKMDEENEHNSYTNNSNNFDDQNDLEGEHEVDEVELIFTTDETKEEDFKEELVSIDVNADGQRLQCPISDFDKNLSHESNLSAELEDDVFNDNFDNENQENAQYQTQTFDFTRENSQLYNSKSDNSINQEKSLKSYYSYQDSSFENKSLEKDESFDRFEEKVRIIETDISKVGIHDVEYSLGRRNTCPNPVQYKPILHREAIGKGIFTGRKVRPILGHSNAVRKESGAQTDISALPGSSWRSESNLINKVKIGDNFTTLPSKYPMPGNRLRLADKTVEARRVLLSDIGFTSMVPELSRSADHLCPPNAKPPVTTTTTTSFGQFLRTPDLYSPGFQSQRCMWNTATPSDGSHSPSRYSLCPLTSPLVATRRCSAPVSPSRKPVMKHLPSKVRFANGSLPELRGDWATTIDSGDSTDSLVEEAEHYLRRSIDCIASSPQYSCRTDTCKGSIRRASAPEPAGDNIPPQGWQPFLPRVPRDLRLDHWVKVISPEGRVRGGRVRYVGPLLAQSEQFVGVQLSTPDGHSDGTYNSRRYFQCEPYHGIFVPFKKVVMGWRP